MPSSRPTLHRIDTISIWNTNPNNHMNDPAYPTQSHPYQNGHDYGNTDCYDYNHGHDLGYGYGSPANSDNVDDDVALPNPYSGVIHDAFWCGSLSVAAPATDAASHLPTQPDSCRNGADATNARSDMNSTLQLPQPSRQQSYHRPNPYSPLPSPTHPLAPNSASEKCEPTPCAGTASTWQLDSDVDTHIPQRQNTYYYPNSYLSLPSSPSDVGANANGASSSSALPAKI